MAVGNQEERPLYACFKALGFILLLSMIGIHTYRQEPGMDGRGPGVAFARQEDPLSGLETRAALEDLLERLDESQRRIEQAMGDLDTVSKDLGREQTGFQRRLDVRNSHFETSVLDDLRQGLADVAAVKAIAEVNSARLGLIESETEFPQERGKTMMIHPTVQLRGNGTVGSAVLVYSGPFAGEGPAGRHCNLALTAFHVVAEVLGSRLERDIDVVRLYAPGLSKGQKALSARLIAYDKSRDIALLYLDTDQQLASLARLKSDSLFKRLDIFSEACVVGCPLGSNPVATMGQITAIDKDVDGEKFWMINAPTYFGNSGGGVYSVPDCELIGIFSMIYTYGKAKPRLVPHMGLFLPLASIRSWLETEGLGFVHEGIPVPSSSWRKMGYNPPNRSPGGE